MVNWITVRTFRIEGSLLSTTYGRAIVGKVAVLLLLAIFVILLLVNAVTPWFKKIGFGRLPGDLNFRLFGREFNLPFTTTIVLSLAAAGLARIL